MLFVPGNSSSRSSYDRLWGDGAVFPNTLVSFVHVVYIIHIVTSVIFQMWKHCFARIFYGTISDDAAARLGDHVWCLKRSGDNRGDRVRVKVILRDEQWMIFDIIVSKINQN